MAVSLVRRALTVLMSVAFATGSASAARAIPSLTIVELNAGANSSMAFWGDTAVLGDKIILALMTGCMDSRFGWPTPLRASRRWSKIF